MSFITLGKWDEHWLKHAPYLYQLGQLKEYRMFFKKLGEFFIALIPIVLVLAVAGGILYLNFLYHMAGYENCKANGSSTAWCLVTYEWQSFKALIF